MLILNWELSHFNWYSWLIAVLFNWKGIEQRAENKKRTHTTQNLANKRTFCEHRPPPSMKMMCGGHVTDKFNCAHLCTMIHILVGVSRFHSFPFYTFYEFRLRCVHIIYIRVYILKCTIRRIDKPLNRQQTEMKSVCVCVCTANNSNCSQNTKIICIPEIIRNHYIHFEIELNSMSS